MYILAFMKTLLLSLLALILSVMHVNAQDVIVLKQGDELNVKIEKIDASAINYYNPSDTVLRTMQKSEVFMIKFSNGTKYVMESAPAPTTISKRELEELARKKLATGDYEKYKKAYNRRKVSGIVLLSVGGAFATTGITLICEGIRIDRKDYAYQQSKPIHYQSGYYSPRGMWMTVGGIILTVASFPPLLIGTIQMSLTPKYKRKMNEAKQQLGFYPSAEPGNAIYGTQTGLAMRLSF